MITAEVVAITDKHVIVNAGLKSESLIDLNEFKNAQGELEVKVGDFVTVTIESVENGFGETKLSREKAKRAADWLALEEAMESGEILSGVINGKVKGGLTVMINSIRAFLPGSLVDVRPVKDTSHFEGKEVEFKVIKLDRKRNNVGSGTSRASSRAWSRSRRHRPWPTASSAPSARRSPTPSCGPATRS